MNTDDLRVGLLLRAEGGPAPSTHIEDALLETACPQAASVIFDTGVFPQIIANFMPVAEYDAPTFVERVTRNPVVPVYS